MWLGTYQPNYTLDDLKEQPDLLERGDYPEMPFNPVWCIPCEDPHTMFLSAILDTPRYLDLFCMFQTDNYLRLDKQKWKAYREARAIGLKNGEDVAVPDIHEFVADVDAPDIECEFVVSEEIFEQRTHAQNGCVMAFITGMSAFFKKEQHMPIIAYQNGEFLSFATSEEDNCREALQAMYDRLPVIDYDPDVCGIWDDHPVKNLDDARRYKLLFDLVFMPVLYYFQRRSYADGSLVLDYAILNPAQLEIIRTVSAYHEQVKSGFNMDRYLQAVNKLDCCMSGDIGFIQYLFEHGRPNRNDPCPCGSGKKYKKCCGRYAF